MKPKFSYSTAAEVPEALKALYTETGGVWQLDVEGAAPLSRVTEFRDNNIALAKQVKDLETKWAGLDETKVREIMTKADAIEKATVKTQPEIDKLIAERVEAVTKAKDAEIATITTKATAAGAELARVKIHTAAVDLATKAGLLPTANADLIMRAERVWTLDDKGQPVAMAEGKPIFDPKTGLAVTMETWVSGLVKDAAHLFKPSQGGGSGDKTPGGGNPGANPFKAGESFNMTQQAQLIQSDPVTARQLAAAAGVTLPAGI